MNFTVYDQSFVALSSQSPRIMGVGAGLVFVIALDLISLIVAFLGQYTKNPRIFFLIAFIIVAGTTIFMLAANVETQKKNNPSNTVHKYNYRGVTRILFSVLLIFFAALALLSLFVEHIKKQTRAHYIDDLNANDRRKFF